MVSYLIAFFVSLFLTPLIIKFNKKFNLLENPSDGKIHTLPVAKYGGISIFISILPFLYYLNTGHNFTFLIYLSFILILLIGIVDDYKTLNPFVKLILQLCSILIITFYIYKLILPHNINNVLLLFYIFFIIFWFLFCTNSINIIDGIDSLACSITIMILAYLAYLFYLIDEIPLSQYCLILLASVWGFLIFNFPKAVIFLGDTGSLFLGFNISLLTVIYFLNNPKLENILIILVLCAIPTLDSVFAIFRRILRGESPFKGDLHHIHHKFYFKTLDSNRVVTILLSLQIIMSVFLVYFDNNISIKRFIFIYLFSIAYLFIIYKLIKTSKILGITDRIIRPSPVEIVIFFIIDLACLSFILIPQWVIIISFVFFFIPYIAIFSYERLKYLLNVILIFTIFLFFLNYVNYNIRMITMATLILFIIFIWASNKIHFKNILNVNGDDLLFLNGLLILLKYSDLTVLNSLMLFVFAIILYLYNKKYLLLLY
jgi:UDP-GlcNAc:undecaprenyl-phosphate GlcNAc-1-phosphate transferase